MRQHGWFRPHVRGLTAISSTTLREGGGWWIPGSQLDLDFANDRSFNRKTGYNATPNGLLTYTSPSPKMVYGTDGVLRYAPHNLLTYSAQFDNAAWTKAASSVTADSILAPDGTTTADKLIESATTAIHYAYRSFSVTAGVSYTFSVVMKSGERTRAWLYASSVGEALAYFNLADGTVSATSGTLSPSASVSDLGGGYYRCSITFRPATTASIFIGGGPTTASGTTNYAGDGTSGIYVWGAQLNLGASALTYTPTTTAAVYALPIDHDPITHAPLGVLIEEQRTNLLTYSQEFDNAAWTKSRATVTANAAVAPDGTTTADKLIPTAVSNTHRMYQGSITHGVLRTYTYTCYLKAAEYTGARLAITDAAEVDAAYCAFDLTDGTLAGIAQAFGTFSAASASVVDCGDGWYHCTLIATCDATEATVSAWVASGNASGGLSFTGDGTSGIYVWGAQLEAGSFATSVIQTGSAQVTRAADQVSLATSAFNFSATEGTLSFEAETAFSGSYVYEISDGSISERIIGVIGNNNHLYVVDGSVVQAAIDAGTIAVNTMTKAAQAFSVNDFAAVISGGSVGTDVSGTLPTVTSLRVGSQVGGTNNINGHIKRLTYWNTRKTNAELQALSA